MKLIDKLRAADGPDRELDEAIALKLGLIPEGDGWAKSGPQTWHKNLDMRNFPTRYDAAYQPPKLTASIDAALALVAEMLPRTFGSEPSDGWRVGIERERVAYKGRWLWTAWVRKHAQDAIEGGHTSPAIAILIALLTALEGESA